MGYRNREIETKLMVYGQSLEQVNSRLKALFGSLTTRVIFGSSIDTYWAIKNPEVEADFIRMRERDGIRQITVKGKDKGTNLDRLEIDVDSTSDVQTISKLLTASFGAASGRIGKTYHVYILGGSTHNTVCCYTTTAASEVIVEVEATSMERMLELETIVMDSFRKDLIKIERAPGSLYEMYILGRK